MVRGVFGGTFDPVHCAHVHFGKQLMYSGFFSCIHYVVNGHPPHRPPPRVSAAARFAMLDIALADEPGLLADDRDIKRGGVSYMADTLLELRADLGRATPLAFILGADALAAMPTWHHASQLAKLAHLVVLGRAGDTPCAESSEALGFAVVDNLETLTTAAAGRAWYAAMPEMQIAASDIRLRLQQKLAVADLLPDAVLRYICQQGLYGSS